MILLSSIAARSGRHQGVQCSRSPVLRVPCWTKELISSSYDGVRSGRHRRPVAPSCVCACAADHITTSRSQHPDHNIPSPCAHDYRLFSGASDCIPMQPSTGTSCACRSASHLIYPVLLRLLRVRGAAISRGVGVNIAPFSCARRQQPALLPARLTGHPTRTRSHGRLPSCGQRRDTRRALTNLNQGAPIFTAS